MAPEETELTFIRCPSCRSLVPAAAARCRMCGQPLESKESAAGDASAEALSRKSRVRQRTISVSGDDVDSVKSEITAARGAEPEPVIPLPPPIASPVAAKIIAREEVAPPPIEAEDELFEGFEDGEEEAGEEVEEEEIEEHGGDSALQDVKRRRRRRRRRRKKTPGGPELTSPVEPSITPARSWRASEPEKERVMEAHAQPQMKSVEPHSAPKVQSGPAPAGELLGWLVSYTHSERGSSQELRSGRFFITKDKLRPTDFVVADPTLSAPHCLVHASRGSLRMQDLLSENGTFLRRSGADSYERQYEEVEVRHGDWIRFGNYEILVCLIPQKVR